jgi:hypothetical protein
MKNTLLLGAAAAFALSPLIVFSPAMAKSKTSTMGIPTGSPVPTTSPVNVDVIVVFGNNQTPTVTQNGAPFNAAAIATVGLNNTATIGQAGVSNTGIVTQIGAGNRASTGQLGLSNWLTTVQIGL